MEAGSRVLVVDDDAMVRRAYKRVLGPVCRLSVVPGGDEALALLERDWDFELIICDLTMPRMDGRALLQAVSERYPELAGRMVFCSGLTEPGVMDELSRVTGNPVLRKPVAPAVLRGLVSNFDSGADDVTRFRESGVIRMGGELREAL